jgi:hypothetical protein
MTETPLTSDEVFARCDDYASEMEWGWEVKDDEVGYLTLPDGFLEERVVRVGFDEQGVVLAAHIFEPIPHAFFRTAVALHAASDGRLVVADGEALMWCARFDSALFNSPGKMDDTFATMQREVFVAESLLALYQHEQREIPVPSVIGLGFETMFDVKQ